MQQNIIKGKAEWRKEHFNKSILLNYFHKSQGLNPTYLKVSHSSELNHNFTSKVCLAGWFSWQRRLAVSWSDRITSRFSSSSNLISCKQNRKGRMVKMMTGFLVHWPDVKIVSVCITFFQVLIHWHGKVYVNVFCRNREGSLDVRILFLFQ